MNLIRKPGPYAIVGFVIFAVSFPRLFAQQPEAKSHGVVFRTETTLIEVEVHVKDRQGKPVASLEKNDFTLFENSQAQQIANFEFVSPPRETLPGGATEPARSAERSAAIAAGEQLRGSTLVYIASWVGPEQRERVSNAIRNFVEERMRPGMLVSIQGAPFTGNKARLIAMLDGAGRRKNSPGLVDVQSGTNYTEDYAALVRELQEFDTETLGSAIQHMQSGTARGVLLRAIDLVQKLSVYPGSKRVVLFSRGIPMGRSSMPEIDDLLKLLEKESLRARVRFYLMGMTGLTALTDESNATRPFLDARDPASTTSAVTAGLQPDFADSQRGLQILAAQTGGEALVNSNDLGEIFDKVSDDLESYYVLGYYPSDPSQQGRRRKLRVEVARPGLRLEYRRGYEEEKSFSRMTEAEKGRQLERAILSTIPQTGIELSAGFEFFRGRDGKPQLLYSLGVGLEGGPYSSRTARKHEYSAVVTARAEADGRLRGFGGHRMQVGPISEAANDLGDELRLPALLALPAGRYTLKTVVRNDRTGEVGSIESGIEVPAFDKPTTPSSLMLTTEVTKATEIAGGTTSASGNDVAHAESGRGIRAAGVEFFPESRRIFRRGETLYVLYDLYNVPADLVASPPGPRVFLMHGVTQLDRPPFRSYEVFPSTGRNELRYVAKLDTSTLEPGEYNLVVPVPHSEQAIFQKFSLIEE